jgi:hypothetical protein
VPTTAARVSVRTRARPASRAAAAELVPFLMARSSAAEHERTVSRG